MRCDGVDVGAEKQGHGARHGLVILADGVLVLHAAFIVWAALGRAGGVALAAPAVGTPAGPGLGLSIEASAGICPLTPLEMALRHRAGQGTYEGSFIDHHLGALIYPQGLTPAAQWRIALGLAGFNLALYGLIAWRRMRRRGMR